MRVQKLLCIIKPDAVRKNHVPAICKRLTDNGFRIVLSKKEILDEKEVRLYTGSFSQAAFYPKFISHMTSGPSVVMLIEAQNAFEIFSKLKGATDPKAASPGTLRADFGTDMTENAVHASDTVESAAREINIFFPTTQQMGTIYAISGPSGVGKSTLIKKACATVNKLQPVVPYTTRQKREYEQDGDPYHFISKEQFLELLQKEDFLQHFEFEGTHYGTLKRPIMDSLKTGMDLIIDVDYLPARKVREAIPACKSIFILPPSNQDLRKRLEERKEKDIEKRIGRSKEVMMYYVEYDHVIVNDDLDTAFLELQSIIRATRTNPLSQEFKYEKSFLSMGLESTGLKEIVTALECIPEVKQILNNFSQLKVERLPGWNNASYKLKYGREEYFLRLPRKAKNVIFDRVAEKRNLEIVAKQNIYIKTIYFDERTGVYLAPYITTQSIMADKIEQVKNVKTISIIMGIINKLHHMDTAFQNRADPIEQTENLFREVKDEKIDGIGVDLDQIGHTFKLVSEARKLALKLCPKLVSCHNDLTPFNFLQTQNGIILSDWECSGLNDPFYDFADLSVESNFSQEQDDLILSYQDDCLFRPVAEVRLTLNKPIIEFLLSVWLLYQIKVENNAASISTFQATFKRKYQHCLDLLESDKFKRARSFAESMSLESTQDDTFGSSVISSAGKILMTAAAVGLAASRFGLFRKKSKTSTKEKSESIGIEKEQFLLSKL